MPDDRLVDYYIAEKTYLVDTVTSNPDTLPDSDDETDDNESESNNSEDDNG